MNSSELAKRLKACDGVSCLVPVSAWSAACLAEAKGSQEEFCAHLANPNDKQDFSQWQEGFCREEGLPANKCQMATGIVGGYCTTRQ